MSRTSLPWRLFLSHDATASFASWERGCLFALQSRLLFAVGVTGHHLGEAQQGVKDTVSPAGRGPAPPPAWKFHWRNGHHRMARLWESRVFSEPSAHQPGQEASPEPEPTGAQGRAARGASGPLAGSPGHRLRETNPVSAVLTLTPWREEQSPLYRWGPWGPGQ